VIHEVADEDAPPVRRGVGDVFRHLVVQRELPLFDQLHHGDGRELLRHRPGAIHGLRGGRNVVLDIGQPIPLHDDGIGAANDGDRQRRHPAAPNRRLGERVRGARDDRAVHTTLLSRTGGRERTDGERRGDDEMTETHGNSQSDVGFARNVTLRARDGQKFPRGAALSARDVRIFVCASPSSTHPACFDLFA
jgi:hypothetical protein